jgi:DNA-binding NarL/FixJ family response regulator
MSVKAGGLLGETKMFKTLIVEDNTTFRESLKATLGTEFPLMIIEEATDGKVALEKVITFQPDLIFMDIKLPGQSGLDLTRKIKADGAGIVIIILTSYDLPEYREAGQQYGADHFVSKGSSTREEILELVRSISSYPGLDLPDPEGNGDSSMT